MRPIPILAVTAGLVAGVLAPAFFPDLRSSSEAGTAIRMDLDEAFMRSDLVIEGTVVAGSSGENSKGQIYTDWTVDVDRTFWGPERESRTLRIPGGVLAAGRGTVIPGMPRLAIGENVVLLLSEESSEGLRMPVGLSQGKYRIVTATDGTRTAIQTGDHVTLLGARTMRTVDGLEMLEYADLVARMEAASQVRQAAIFEEIRGLDSEAPQPQKR